MKAVRGLAHPFEAGCRQMPSQIFDDGFGPYEVPDGQRLKFSGGEGADNVYKVKSSFEKAAEKGKRTTSAMGTQDRFNSVGSYARVAEPNPGPGTYSSPSKGARPSSAYGTLGPKSPGKQRMKFDPQGEGADNYYSARGAFDDGRSAGARGGRGGFGQSERFGFGSYVAPKQDGGNPGPGSYSATGALHVKKSGRTPQPAHVRSTERLKFAAAPGHGDSPGAIYGAPSAFDRAARASAAATSAMGSAERFVSHGSYLSKDASTPGPGTYTDPRATSPPRPRSAPPPRQKDSRVDFGAAGEGTSAHYHLGSTFDKVATPSKQPSASMGTAQRFGKVNSHYNAATEDLPGPGSYSYAASPSRATPSSQPRPQSATARNRLDFGPQGEGVAPVYTLRSEFDKLASPHRGPTSAMGTQHRFRGAGAYVNTKEVPGPGNYDARVESVKRGSRASSFASPRMRPPGWRRPLNASLSQHSVLSAGSARRQHSFSSSP